jgi:hypothetical protein
MRQGATDMTLMRKLDSRKSLKIDALIRKFFFYLSATICSAIQIDVKRVHL